MTYSTDLEVRGRPVLVCGGGPAALGRVLALLEAGAEVSVVSASAGTTISDLAERGLLTLHQREFDADDLRRTTLVVAASEADDDDAQLIAAARLAGVLVSRARTAAARPSTDGTGSVTLVGGGPGDPGLLTIAGLDAVRGADVIVCDRLAPLAILRQAPPSATVIDVAKIPRGAFTPQEQINALLVQHAQAGRRVVRLKGGDNFVFGRGGEEWQACAAAGVPVTVIPGVSSAIAGPALAGVPLTHRQLTQGFTVISGHVPPDDPASTLDYGALARTNTTLVIMMGVATLPAITATLVAEGLAPGTPALTVADAGLPSQRSVRGTVTDIASLTRREGLTPPAITVIGAVAGFVPQASGMP